MRRFLSGLLLMLFAAHAWAGEPASRPPTDDELALFREALKNAEQDQDHWAYTETVTIRGKGGLLKDEMVVRYDPSKPYEEQYLPLKIDGKEPSKRQLKKYRQKGLDRGKAVVRRAKDGDKAKKEEEKDVTVRLDVDHPLVREAGEARVIYEIPIEGKKSPVPVDKVRIVAEIDRPARRLVQARMQVLDSFRVKAIAKVKRGDMRADFTVVDAAFPSVITHMEGDVGASILLIPLNATVTCERTDVRRVKAFDERFSVTLAPLQTFGF
jgi:hypothetical protein